MCEIFTQQQYCFKLTDETKNRIFQKSKHFYNFFMDAISNRKEKFLNEQGIYLGITALLVSEMSK